MSGQVSSVAERVRRQIVSDIDTAVLQAGDRLGSERDLAERFDTSRSTLRQVLAGLEQAGIVHSRPGRTGGIFVGKGTINRDLSSVTPYPDYLSQQGYDGGTTVVGTSIEPADATVAARLGTSPGELAFHLQRVWLADAQPVALESAWFPVNRFPGLLDHSLSGNVYEILAEKYGITPGEAIEQIEIVALDEQEAPLLNCEVGGSGLQVLRQVVDTEGQPFEFSRDLFHPSRTRITVHFPGPGHRQVSHSVVGSP